MVAVSRLAAPLLQAASARLLVGVASVQTAAMHAVTGATASIAPVSPSKNPASSQVGESLTWVFRTSDGKSESYEVKDLPEGLTFEETRGLGVITGSPIKAGDHVIEIRGWKRVNFGGDATDSYYLQLNVAPVEGYGAYAHWADVRKLDETHRAPDEDPDHDGSSNFLEYAFDTDPLTPNPLVGPRGDGIPFTSPQIVQRTPETLRVAYIRRRKNAGSEASYLLESSTDLSEWVPVDGEPWITELTGGFEGVVTEMPRSGKVQFFRLRLEMAPGA